LSELPAAAPSDAAAAEPAALKSGLDPDTADPSPAAKPK
jgi:hypothetical protein